MALRYVRTVGAADMYRPAQRRTALAAVLEQPDGPHAALLEQGFQAASLTLGLGGDGGTTEGQVVARAVPLGVRDVQSSSAEATIAIWTMSLVGIDGAGTTRPVQQYWSTETVRLRRSDAGWRVVSSEHVDGPAPIAAAQLPAAPGALAAAAQVFREVALAG